MAGRTKKTIILKVIPDNVDLSIVIKLLEDVRYVTCKSRNLIGDCWIRGNDSTVYTSIRINGENKRAHRVSFEIFNGRALLNNGCHHCDVPACINPDHIFDGTNRQNVWDSMRKGRAFPIILPDRKTKFRESWKKYNRELVNITFHSSHREKHDYK